ncbi:hypothetical protein H6F76_10380 [Leptolyngbya sp. FACHB-321]|uniref:hypothetical protein n=1 Tax=Leptolyngbya sp. FACHB-321 TaxID=2692807 RepID=UPI0016864212|nr:hypothetical protein [Leptolyngbya sp. FACHB-321]MBD2035428.1 hypothetical protein [Leptolyngbya sp. FACHB-321]
MAKPLYRCGQLFDRLRKAKRHALKPALVKQDTIMTTMATQAREYCEKIDAIASCSGVYNSVAENLI